MKKYYKSWEKPNEQKRILKALTFTQNTTLVGELLSSVFNGKYKIRAQNLPILLSALGQNHGNYTWNWISKNVPESSGVLSVVLSEFSDYIYNPYDIDRLKKLSRSLSTGTVKQSLEISTAKAEINQKWANKNYSGKIIELMKKYTKNNDDGDNSNGTSITTISNLVILIVVIFNLL